MFSLLELIRSHCIFSSSESWPTIGRCCGRLNGLRWVLSIQMEKQNGWVSHQVLLLGQVSSSSKGFRQSCWRLNDINSNAILQWIITDNLQTFLVELQIDIRKPWYYVCCDAKILSCQGALGDQWRSNTGSSKRWVDAIAKAEAFGVAGLATWVRSLKWQIGEESFPRLTRYRSGSMISYMQS